MNYQQMVHRLLIANGEMTSPQLAKASGLAYTTVRDACNRLLKRRAIAVVCVEDGHNLWASMTKHLVEDGRGEAEGSATGRARGTQLMIERKREREQATAQRAKTGENNCGILRP